MADDGVHDRPLVLAASSSWEEAASVFLSSGIIAYPTETFYGLCVNPFDREALRKLFKLKGRPADKPITLIIKDESMLGSVASSVSALSRRLISGFWPGPLTIIFDASRALPPELTAGTGSVGVRVSSSPHAARLSSILSSPITATSANPADKAPPVEPCEVIEYFDGNVDLLIDGGRLEGKKGSTIVDARGDRLVLVREGEIPFELIERLV